MSNRLPTTGSDAGNWGTILNNYLSVSHTPTGTLSNFYVNVKNDFGAVGDGTTDDTTAIQNAINSVSSGGGTILLPTGKYLISTPLALNNANTQLIGTGRFATIIRPSVNFSGSNIISITADHCGIRDLKIAYASSSVTSNPTADGIQVTAARYVTLQDLEVYYVNGWAIQITGTASLSSLGAMLDKIHLLHTAGGIHTVANTAQNFGMQIWMSNLNLEIVDTNDCLFVEDSSDVLITNINGAAGQNTATNSMIHIKGASSSVYISNFDIGVYPGPSNAPTVLIESGSNGTPSGVTFMCGVMQAGTTNISVSAGTNIRFSGAIIKKASTDGVQISGGTVSFEDCTWLTNNQSNATAYDVNITQSSGNSYFKGCHFTTGVGSGAVLVTNPVNDTNHKGYFLNSFFVGAGTTPSTVFAATPQIVRGCVGYNPRGSITPIAIGASPFTGNSSQNDITIYFTAINGMTGFKIGGTSIGAIPALGIGYRVPARQSFEIDWVTTAPTYIWIAD